MSHNFSAFYYDHPYARSCRSKVTACEESGHGYAVRLERTCFYPEGGGQPGDTGVIVPVDDPEAAVRVTDTRERDGNSVHITDKPLEPGTEVDARIDWERRYDFMQQHTGEHIFSGLVNRRFGYDNVGFHMNEDFMTFDFNGDLSEADIAVLETEVNRAIQRNIATVAGIPEGDPNTLTYRSKLELTGDVRLVTIPDFDTCACCGLHVAETGEIGVFKIVDRMTYKGGVRLTALAGMRAYRDYQRKHRTVRALMSELSTAETELEQAVRDLNDKLAAGERELRAANELAARMYAEAHPDRLIIWFTDNFDTKAVKYIALAMAETAPFGAVILVPLGEREYTLALAGETVDAATLREALAPFEFRGGGNRGLIQGKLKGEEADIRAALRQWSEA